MIDSLVIHLYERKIQNTNPLSDDDSYNIPLEGDGLVKSEFDKELDENVTV